MTLGFRIHTRSRQVSADIAEAFRTLPVANVSDCMSRMFAGGTTLRPVHTHAVTLSGPAVTVRCRPGDNLILHYALDHATPGDVIVVDAGGEVTTAIMGEIMVAIAQKRGIAGIIINGAIRDADEIRSMKFPVFAAGITHRGPYKDGPGEMNTPISISGMTIEPGDLILGDGDGILSVPYDQAEALLAAARAKYDAEQVELRQIAEGSEDRTWVEETLKSRGCELV